MRAPTLEFERRRPVWDALSELFLDTELEPADHQRIARALAESGYSTQELESVLRRELAPVLMPNLLAFAGEWAGFDLDWLEAAVLRRAGRRRLSWLSGGIAMKLVRRDWESVRALLGPARTG